MYAYFFFFTVNDQKEHLHAGGHRDCSTSCSCSPSAGSPSLPWTVLASKQTFRQKQLFYNLLEMPHRHTELTRQIFLVVQYRRSARSEWRWTGMYLEFPETGCGAFVFLEKPASLQSKAEQLVWRLTPSVNYIPHLKIQHNIKSHWESRSRTFTKF